jgi:hypothetical protein
MTDNQLFGRLRGMWVERDPMPDGLIDSVLVAIATEGLAIEYALLTLLARSTELAGVRGPSNAQTLEFSDGEVTMLLRVSPLGDGRRRVDGWLAPAAALTVRLTQGHDDMTTSINAEGRFEFVHVPAGLTRVWLEPDAGAGRGSARGFTTPEFDL